MVSHFEQMLAQQWHLIALVVFAGAFLQGLSGVGLGMVASPLLALFAPELVPGPLLMISCVIAVMSVFRERSALDMSGLGYALTGRLLASVPAALLIGVLPLRALAITFALVILLAVGASLLKLPLRPTRLNLLIAGTLSGFMGTLTSVGLPPIALVYQSVPPAQLRASIGGFLAVGTVISIAALAAVGRFGSHEIGLGLAMLAPLFLGFAASGRLRHHLPARHMRLIVLGIAAASAAILLLRQLAA
ncbi:sulfite exporter TauE/SafE family protein [Pseudodonghicola flavimaris]|uniref:Probable membrane transporter protein n=1 Tax=Pseudodonghicola flavimaris TaxID=3050036 RepID=A0ABT7EX26_9RHOB|nr:sulfite exporter TauE/SafE family protein [Pseudodonghicola flavimaris]MDK3016835.1 sulfite exporter TauE/SafE family protein [Pseudodonghicola flavimaris]